MKETGLNPLLSEAVFSMTAAKPRSAEVPQVLILF